MVDDDAVSRRVVCQTLSDAGLETVSCSSGAEALTHLADHAPRGVLVALAMPQPDGYAVLQYIRQTPRLADVPVVALTDHDSDDEIGRVFASGADDYVRKPFRSAELIARLRGQVRLRDCVERISQRERHQQTVLELTQKLASTLDLRDILYTVVRRVAEVAHVDRCSIVLFAESGEVGYVLATSDDEQLRDLPIDLGKYPEIREVCRTGRALVIRDATRHPVFEFARKSDAAPGFNSLALLPILHDHGPMGVLFLRAKGHATFDAHDLSLVTTIANATAIALRNAQILRSLRAETEKITTARKEAERRVQLFRRYADFFESAADGMIVIDRSGQILFANPRAREVIGYSETELTALGITTLVTELDRHRAERMLHGFSDGVYPRGVDLTINSNGGDQVIINVSFNSVLHEDDAVLCTFHDVTLERQTAVELKQTKEFLERVIDSSVDGIVSANLSGTVLLFNRAAARIFGYSASDVVGKMGVERLYPPGVARDIMKKIRDPMQSGYGRLEDYRVDMLCSNGEQIPVSLSASLVLDNGRPIGSVGIFTDVRDKLRMQERLERAQEELRGRERMAIVAELAGAAAHELNQPLTSVIGYAELLRRKLEHEPQLSTAAAVIIRESERMAEIVRKVGKITKYETKSYVGGAKILDLEKASGTEPEAKDV